MQNRRFAPRGASCRLVISTVLLAFWTTVCSAGAEPGWQPVVTELLKSEKTGYGGLCGMVVDHETGDVWLNLSDRGLFRSGSGASSFKRISDAQPKGRTESPGCLMLDPTGKSKKMLCALVYGSPVGVSRDHGKTWSYLDAKCSHVDWCAVDWLDPRMRLVLALKHESGGLLLASNDGGRTFHQVGKGFTTGWVFDDQTAVVAQERTKESRHCQLMRTIDGGATWRPTGAYTPVGSQSAQALPRWRDGKLYWLTDKGLIVTSDKGKTWTKVGDVANARYGPVFGKNNDHLLVLTSRGIVESTDGGASWSKPIPAPAALKGIGGLTWLEYDPRADILYIMKMGSDLYKLARGK